MNASLAALAYLVSGVLFILSLRGLSSPETSRQGNTFGMIGMGIAIVATLFHHGMDFGGIVLVIAEFVYTLTDPPLRLMRKIIPPLRIGGTSWDLGFLVLFLGLSFLQRMIPYIFA